MPSFANSEGSILIVDDEPNVLFFLTKIFQPRGYTTLTAQSGEEALNYFESCEEKIDMMIIDVEMPGLNGIDVIQKMREGGKEIPTIVISGMDQRREECETLGVKAFLVKPYSLEDLYECVEKVLGNKEGPAEDYQLPLNVQPSAKILIVDDEPEVAQMIGEALFEDFPESDFTVRGAMSGKEAIEISAEFQPDIGIIDIRMPEMSGDELIERMKSGEGSCPRDFVVYTGVTDQESMKRWRTLGHRVLTKPTNIETLHDVLSRICVRHHLIKKKED